MKFSIIIPYKLFDEKVKKCFQSCLEQDYSDFEIIALPDRKTDEVSHPKIRIIGTRAVKPSAKRNIAIKEARGELLAFLDSDAFPIKEWLSIALRYFKNDEVGGVGGPQLTPLDSNIGQKVSGYIFSSAIATGAFALRYKVRHKFRRGLPVKEMPACNLIIRKGYAEEVNGFDETLLTGEDSKLCFDIRKLDKKILYIPEAIVYHYRRNLWQPHLKQVWIYGRDKAYVIKEDFSWDKLYYFIPFCFISFLIFGLILSLFSSILAWLYLVLLAIYFIIIFSSSLVADLILSPIIFVGIFLTHISYGFGFLYGLIKKRNSGRITKTTG